MKSIKRKDSLFKAGNSYDSVLEHMNTLIQELKTLYIKATKDYNAVVESIDDDNATRLALESVRSNALKSIESYYKLRVDLIRIHLSIVSTASKSPVISDEEAANKTTKLFKDEDPESMQEMLEELRKQALEDKN